MLEADVRAEARVQAKVELVSGLVWAVVGGALTGITYAIAGPGGTFVVFGGLVAYGAYRVVRGLYYLANPSSLIKQFATETEAPPPAG